MAGRLPVSLLFQHRPTYLRLQCHAELLSKYVTLLRVRTMKTLPPQSHNCSISERLRTSSSFSRVVICRDFQEKDDRQFQLMDMPHVCGRDITRSINNWKSYLRIILKYDQDFRPSQFLIGAQQAILRVSKWISEGNFKALEGLLTAKAAREVKQNFEKLSSDQRDLIAMSETEIQRQFIYDVRLKESPLLKEPWTKGWDEIIPATKVEIMVVLEGSHLKQTKCDMEITLEKEERFFCNYVFERTFGVEGWHSGWIITQLNHFLPTV
ncbi:uncharacterized protein LOC135473798 [Liolophura sinensis]|uniref:uncharacterized protein LOC135473798 n=1 Tax=Liolophura sinensis TaxID=3198878 RepID=UPI0031584828